MVKAARVVAASAKTGSWPEVIIGKKFVRLLQSKNESGLLRCDTPRKSISGGNSFH